MRGYRLDLCGRAASAAADGGTRHLVKALLASPAVFLGRTRTIVGMGMLSAAELHLVLRSVCDTLVVKQQIMRAAAWP
jgi:hypothetical protein